MHWFPRLLGDLAALLAAVSAGIAIAQPIISRSVSETGHISFSRMSWWQRLGLLLAGVAAILALIAAGYDFFR